MGGFERRRRGAAGDEHDRCLPPTDASGGRRTMGGMDGGNLGLKLIEPKASKMGESIKLFGINSEKR